MQTFYSCRTKLNHNAAFLNLPIGLEANLEGIVDLIKMKAYYFEEPHGITIREDEIPDEMKDISIQKRQELIGKLTCDVWLLSFEFSAVGVHSKSTSEELPYFKSSVARKVYGFYKVLW